MHSHGVPSINRGSAVPMALGNARTPSSPFPASATPQASLRQQEEDPGSPRPLHFLDESTDPGGDRPPVLPGHYRGLPLGPAPPGPAVMSTMPVSEGCCPRDNKGCVFCYNDMTCARREAPWWRTFTSGTRWVCLLRPGQRAGEMGSPFLRETGALRTCFQLPGSRALSREPRLLPLHPHKARAQKAFSGECGSTNTEPFRHKAQASH